jgi:hypothetical protein
MHGGCRHDPRLDLRRHRHHDLASAQHADHRRHARYGAQRAIETQFADVAVALRGVGRKLFEGSEHADGDGHVETGSGLALAGRGQVDRYALVRRPRQTAAEHGGAYTIARLAACLIRQADDLIAGQSGADMHLDGDGTAGGAEDAGR